MRYIIAIPCDIPVVAVKSAEWVTAGTGGTAALLHCGIGHSPGEHEALAQDDGAPVPLLPFARKALIEFECFILHS